MTTTVIYFDGLCHLCSREIDHYRKQKSAERLRFVDITSPEFDAVKERLDPFRVHREMHVRRSDGSLAIGVDAFLAIWDVLPRYRFAARWGRRTWANRVLRLGYQAFVQIRPYLPRKKADCSKSPYCES